VNDMHRRLWFGTTRAIFRAITFTLAAVLIIAGSHSSARATVQYQTLKSFEGGAAGASPYAGVIMATDGMLYGTTYSGGASNLGTVFRFGPANGSYSVLHSFSASPDDGKNPESHLIEGTDGALYGTTYYGGGGAGLGTIFKIHNDGSGFTILKSLSGTGGYYLQAALSRGPDGTLFGATRMQGAFPSFFAGFVFRLNPDGSGFMRLADVPELATTGGVLLASDGALYGTGSSLGAASGSSSFYRVTTDGSTNSINYFSNLIGRDQPISTLVEGLDGWLYAMSADGVVKMTKDGSATQIVYRFDPVDNSAHGSDLLVGVDGTLYGARFEGGDANAGFVFQIAPDGSNLVILHSFSTNGIDGTNPLAGLFRASDGTLYGTTSAGGSSGVGTIFSLRLPPPSPKLLLPLVSPDGVVIRFSAPAGKTYLVQRSSALNGTWLTLTNLEASAEGAAQFLDSTPLSTSGFYRVTEAGP